MKQGSKTKRPLVGVTTSSDKGRFMWWCIRLGLWLTGASAIRITAKCSTDYRQCSGYVISGGVDIDPSLYGQVNHASTGIEPERDQLEYKVIEHAIAENKPILGICRGAQMINVVKGGDLHQDARAFYEGFMPSDTMLAKIVGRRTVKLTEEKGRLRTMLTPKTTIAVNSIHHQAIHQLGEGLKIVARDETGIVQAIESQQDQPRIMGVQWHPEFLLYRKAQRQLFRVCGHRS